MTGMLFLSKRAFASLLFVGTCLSSTTLAQGAGAGGRVVLVLPFDNRSADSSVGWIGDSFPDTLNKRLNSAGFLTISRDDRAFAYDHLGLPQDFRPSRATTIRVAQQLDANYVVIGTYAVTAGHISVQARVLAVNSLTLSAPVEDSADLARLFDVENAVAWKVARTLDPAFAVAEPTFLSASGAVPLAAFESYIRGTSGSNAADNIVRLKKAVGEVPDYAAALLALGKLQYATRDFEGATTSLARVRANDRLALEANFYLGLARFNLARYAAAEQAFATVAAQLPLPEVINNEAVAQSRQGKDSTKLFEKASAADPSEEDYHYNLAVALFRNGDTTGAAAEVAAALALRANDNEALNLQAKLKSVPAGSRLDASTNNGFGPLERIRRAYSEAGYRQAAFQLEQLRAVRMESLPPDKRADEYVAAGQEQLNQKQLAEAEENFQSALAANPSSADAHAGLARIREVSGDASAAASEAGKSNQLTPNAEAWMVLARLAITANHLPEAATDVTKALGLDHDNAAAQALRRDLQQRGVTIP